MTQTEEKIQVEETSKITVDSANNGNAPTTKPEASPAFELTMEDKIVNQVEFYFGDVNLPRDKFIKTESAKHDGWFPAELLLKFNKLMSLLPEVPEEEKLSKITEALQKSILVEVNEDRSKIRRNPDMPIPEGNSEGKTIYLKGFNKTETKIQTLLDYFKKYEGMEAVIMRYYKEKVLLPKSESTAATEIKKEKVDTEEGKGVEIKKEEATSNKSSKTTIPAISSAGFAWVKKFKGSIFVVFKTAEQAKAALDDITTYAGHPIMKMMQADYQAMKKKEYQERQELRNAKRKKNGEANDEDDDSSPAKKIKLSKEDEESEPETLKGVLVKLSEIPEGVMRESIKECWFKATVDKEKYDVGFIDFQRGDKEGVIRLTNEGAAKEALALDSLKEGTLALEGESSLKVSLFPTEEEEKAYNLKMQQDRLNFQNKNKSRGGGGGGRGRGRGRGGRRRR